MGKSEILMLLAGVALSIMLAMVVVPMFSSGNEMADRQQVQQELLAIKSSIPLIKSLEGSEIGKITSQNIAKHMEGFSYDNVNSNLIGKVGGATYKVTDDDSEPGFILTLIDTSANKVDLSKLAKMGDICPGNTAAQIKSLADGKDVYSFQCQMKR